MSNLTEFADDEDWLATSKNWKLKLPTGWKAKRVLGQGSYGIAGLWSYEGPPSTPAPEIQHVVVKEVECAKYDRDEDAYIEGKLLKSLAGLKADIY